MVCELDYSVERRWEGDYLKEKCMEVGLEEEYDAYLIRLRLYYIEVFLLLHWIVVLLHSGFLLATCDPIEFIHVDVVFYVIAAVSITGLMCINLIEDLVKRHSWIMYVTSVVAVLILVAVDLLTNVYHYHEHDWITGSFYDTYVILMIYMFLPIPNILAPLALGIVVSSIYVLYYFHYIASKYKFEISNKKNLNQLVADISHQFCLNVLGIFFRVMREILVRSSFLDRHQFVMDDIWLRNARAKEKLFLHSILPPQISQPIQNEIRNRIALAEKHRNVQFVSIGERIMSIQSHPDVTILYADIVNYTHLTTTLSVKTLVTLLHNLYARFDKAASHFTVQRIKFLGDCYYCVAGLINPDPDHAKWCVELGLCMIEQIHEVRASQKVDINIRVGVHSGGLFAGVLGATKLQYDIWGTDVVIANRLEATGVPGHIHTSERTLQFIEDHTYTVLPGTKAAIKDPYLLKHGILTFLIAPAEIPDRISFRHSNDDLESTSSMSVQFSQRSELNESKISLELRNEFKKMPVGPSRLRDKFKKLFNRKARNEPEKDVDDFQASLKFFFLGFTDHRLEYNYMRQPDYMLKFSILFAWCMSLSLISIELVFRHDGEDESYYIGSWVIFSLSILLIITWYKKICYWRYPEDGHKFSATEFNNKINFKWRAELKKKQREARLADQSISILLHNILPAHVVDIYLTSLAKHELYYESYEMVAVMFATLKNFELNLPSLRVLNEIISEFDRILLFYKDDYSVEKVKIVGCTYMAACGLDIRLSSTVSGRQSGHESIVQEVLRARRSINSFHRYNKLLKKKNEDIVFVMTAFALDLMRTLWMCNESYKNIPSDREMFSADIRIGISSGEVMAGVVGASQVHYDIWGNAVNMASRMDSTGVTGHIQVTDETASILHKCGIKCNYRGMTFVKGRGILPTFFVAIDENFNFQYINESWTSGHIEKSSSSSNELANSE
ncbi:hypothetical protein ACLKA6_011223 [Drosophila palustris]